MFSASRDSGTAYELKDEQTIASKWRIGRLDFWKLYLPPLDEWWRSSATLFHQHMRFRTRSLLILTALVAIALVVLIPFIREIARPTNSTYVVAASSDAGVNGYTFLDESQQVRLVVLEKLTVDAKGKRGRNAEPGWLDYKMAPGRRIHIRINDEPVYFGE
jgi:hypothetical protein